MTRSRDYKDNLLKALTNPEEAREYLNTALENKNLDLFLLALRNVVEVNNTINKRT